MTISEKILLSLSRKPGPNDYQVGHQAWDIDNALSTLIAAFPDFINSIKGKTVLDFGCGDGYQSVALIRNGARYALGVDIRTDMRNNASKLARDNNVIQQAEFADRVESRFRGFFDIVISQNSMEHFRNPLEIVNIMKSALKEGGALYIMFGGSWYAPYGAHAEFFTKVPWVNILFDEKTVMNVRSLFRTDGAMRYEDVEGGLNKMSIAKFEHIISQSNMAVRYLKYGCVKRIDVLAKVPILRELFINGVSCILCK